MADDTTSSRQDVPSEGGRDQNNRGQEMRQGGNRQGGNREPGGFRIHAWCEGQGLVTHTLPVGQFEGPYPFHMGGVLID